jgi:hypothetical protein
LKQEYFSWKGTVVERGLEAGRIKIAIVRSRYQESSSNKLRILDCVLYSVEISDGATAWRK